MSVTVRELLGWGLDEYRHRPAEVDETAARAWVRSHAAFEPISAVVESGHVEWGQHAGRADLMEEMAGLTWCCGVVDLRLLQAFQRRLSFDPEVSEQRVPEQDDWCGLVDYSFGPARQVECEVERDRAGGGLVVRTFDPNVHVKASGDPVKPIEVHGGSPFVEVAAYRGRWFLRDGYHRAYAAMRCGIWQLPAVMVEVTTLKDLGAAREWFFAEDVLLRERPPMVIDFLEDELTAEYERPRSMKTIRLTWDESFKDVGGRA